MPWPPLQPPHVSLSSAKLKIWAGNCQAPLQLSFRGLFIKSRAASRILRGIRHSGWDLYPGISIFFGIPEEWETASPLPGRGAGLTGAVRVGGKGAAALGCSYPSSGIFPEGNRNCVFKQPVPSIVGSICSLFSITAALFLDVSLHPAGFAHAIRNPIYRSRHPCSRPSVPQKRCRSIADL